MALVEERRYNDAIILLTEIMKTNPDQFVEAQKLIQQISIVRDRYNALYEKLFTILDPPPGQAIDEDQAYAIIKEMEDLDKDPNKAAVAAFAQAKKSIVFAVENRTYTIIMDTAADYISKKEYPEALEAYFGGFHLHYNGFMEDDYGNIVEDQMEIYQDSIMIAARGFLNLYNTVLEASKIYSNIIQGESVQEIENGYSDYSLVMLEASDYWKTLKGTAAMLDNLRVSVQREDESDIPYISTNRALTVGRSSSLVQEGIAGVLSLVWDDAQKLVAKMLISQLEDTYGEAVDNYESSIFENSRNLFAAAGSISDVVVDVLKLRGDKLYLNNSLAFEDDGMEDIQNELPDILYAQIVSAAVPVYTNLSFIVEELNSLSKTVEASESVKIIEESIISLDNINATIRESESGFKMVSSIDKDALSADLSVDLTKMSDSLTDLQDNQGLLGNNIFSVEVRSVEKLLALKIEPERVSVDDLSENILTSSAYIDGVEELINGLTLKVKRPDRAAQLLSQTKTKLETSDLELNTILSSTEDKKSSIKSMPSIIAQLESAENLKTVISEKKVEIDRLLNTAKILNDEADDAYSLGILRLDEAYGKFDREDFDGARKKYYEAESLFLKSLESREDEKVRNLLTGELAKLDSDITLALNTIIVKEVRQLITRGKDYYNIQDFIKAEQSFQQAEARYKVTNDETNPEIENWLIKITRALEATSGREIAITDPLYSDIIGILNFVKAEFEKGKSSLKTGSKDEADIHFNEAIKNIELVKTPFPRNFKASVMYLEILKYIQEDEFKSYFNSMYEIAINNIKSDPNTADDDLLALYAINPDFPGIKAAVYRSGVASGRIIPPPAQVDIKRATQLYGQAKAIVDADRRSQFPIALAYLEEAILINSDYDAAAVLMDRIRTSTGSISQVAMSTLDSQQLRYAESLYIEGRYLEANIIINQLWANPENRKSSKLNDLKTKVEARL